MAENGPKFPSEIGTFGETGSRINVAYLLVEGVSVHHLILRDRADHTLAVLPVDVAVERLQVQVDVPAHRVRLVRRDGAAGNPQNHRGVLAAKSPASLVKQPSEPAVPVRHAVPAVRVRVLRVRVRVVQSVLIVRIRMRMKRMDGVEVNVAGFDHVLGQTVEHTASVWTVNPGGYGGRTERGRWRGARCHVTTTYG